MTPEGRVKAKLKRLLKEYKPNIYTHWPVLNGMGKPELDCNLVYTGIAVSIECKPPGIAFTKRQCDTTEEKQAGGTIVLGYRGHEVDDEVLFSVMRLLKDGGDGYIEACHLAKLHLESEKYIKS